MGVTPHVAQNQGRHRSRLDQRTTRHPGYEISQRKRKRIEEVFGWMKTVGMLRQLRHRGLERVGWVFTLAAATYNLVRMRTLGSALFVADSRSEERRVGKECRSGLWRYEEELREG